MDPPPDTPPFPALDAVDSAMVQALRRDGRMSVNALAEVVGVSRANAYRRLDRLTDEGIITGFSARVDATKVGLPVTVLMLIGATQHRWQDIQRSLADLPGLSYMAATTGEFDFLLLIRLPDVSDLRDVVLERLQTTPGVVSTRTVFVLDESGTPVG